MALTSEQLELPYFIPTGENISQILSELNGMPVRDRDFTLFRNRTARLPWRWEGTGRYEGQQSPRHFSTQAEAVQNAQSVLSAPSLA